MPRFPSDSSLLVSPNRFSSTRLRRASTLLGALAVTLVVGCGDDRPEMAAPITGKVLLDGKPMEFGSVMFQPTVGHPARGNVKADGTFELYTYEPGDGAVVGEHVVRITAFDSQRPKDFDITVQELPHGNSLIPPRYNSFSESELRRTVVSGKNEPFLLEIKSDPK